MHIIDGCIIIIIMVPRTCIIIIICESIIIIIRTSLHYNCSGQKVPLTTAAAGPQGTQSQQTKPEGEQLHA